MKLRGNKKATVFRIINIPDMIDIEKTDKEINKIRQENNETHEHHELKRNKIYGCCFVF